MYGFLNRLKPFVREEKGTATVEFVAIASAMFMFIFFVVELTLLSFFSLSAQKAAHMGVRSAVVSNPAALAMPAINSKTNNGVFGVSCSDPSAPCIDFGTVTCTGGGAGCDPVAFNRILTAMQRFLTLIEPQNVTITYSYIGLGFAGGPPIPAIEVVLAGVPYQTGIIGAIIGSRGPFSSLPAVSVTLTGEDLSQGGA